MKLGDPKSEKKARESAKLRRDAELSDLRHVLSTPQGRRFVWRKLERFGVFRLSFTPDALRTAFHEGERNAGLGLLAEVNEADPGAMALMAQEARRMEMEDDG